MCLLERPVIFSFDWMESVVPEGTVTVGQLASKAAARKAGASSEPLALRVQEVEARVSRAAGTDTAQVALTSAQSNREKAKLRNIRWWTASCK